jgi:hypothetical protein
MLFDDAAFYLQLVDEPEPTFATGGVDGQRVGVADQLELAPSSGYKIQRGQKGANIRRHVC